MEGFQIIMKGEGRKVKIIKGESCENFVDNEGGAKEDIKREGRERI